MTAERQAGIIFLFFYTLIAESKNGGCNDENIVL